MRDVNKDIRELLEKTAETRQQFLQAELETCFTAVDMAKYELSVGNFDVAEREVSYVEHGIRTLRRFLSEMPLEQRRQIEARVADLQHSLELVKSKLGR